MTRYKHNSLFCSKRKIPSYAVSCFFWFCLNLCFLQLCSRWQYVWSGWGEALLLLQPSSTQPSIQDRCQFKRVWKNAYSKAKLCLVKTRSCNQSCQIFFPIHCLTHWCQVLDLPAMSIVNAIKTLCSGRGKIPCMCVSSPGRTDCPANQRWITGQLIAALIVNSI